VLIILFVSAFILGFKDGFVRKLIGTIGFILAIVLGIRYAYLGGTVVRAFTQFESDFANGLGGFFIFLVVMIITAILKRIIHPFDKVNNLINRIVGGVAGIVQILLLVSALFSILDVVKLPPEATKKGSALYYPVKTVYSSLFAAFKSFTPQVQKTFGK
jgi:membrane protein required for colicin V production